MKLHILGSGTCVPHLRRGSSGYAVTFGDKKILFDCGNGTTWKLAHAGIDYFEIDYIFITHFHPDHTADLIPFLFATKYPFRPDREKPLEVWGPKGLLKLFDSFTSAYESWIQPDCLEIYELSEGRYEFEDFTIKAARTVHTDHSLAYRIEAGGQSLLYTGDTDKSGKVTKLATGVDLLLIECSTTDRDKIKGHLTPAEIAEIVHVAKPRKIVLTHIFPKYDRLDLASEIQRETGIEVIQAEDLMVIDV